MENNFDKMVCPLCKAELTPADTIAVCDTCGAHQHISCWQQNMGCTTESCQGRIKEVIPPAVSAETPVEAPVETPAEAVQESVAAEAPVETPETPVAIEAPADEFVSEPTVSIAANEVFAVSAEAPVAEVASTDEVVPQTTEETFSPAEILAPVAEPAPFAEGEIAPKPKKSKKLFIIIGAAAAVVIAAVVCLVFFLFIPMSKYNSACTALENKEFDTAYQQFVELGGFNDSKEKANETLYKKGEYLLENKEYDDAIDTFTQLGEYNNATEMVTESKYQMAVNYRDNNNYENAYKTYKEIIDYKDSKTQLDAVLIMWEAQVLGNGSTAQSYRLKNNVTLTSDQYMLYYGTLTLYISGHDTANDWDSDNYKVMTDLFSLLPASYEDTATYTNLFTVLSDYGENYLFTDKTSLAKQCWGLGFVQSLAQTDYCICDFLIGNWSTWSGDNYMNFYEKDGGISVSYNLPVDKPSGTKYYDIQDMTFVFTDENDKVLSNAYELTLSDYNTLKVYSYANNRSYTLYR